MSLNLTLAAAAQHGALITGGIPASFGGERAQSVFEGGALALLLLRACGSVCSSKELRRSGNEQTKRNAV